MRSSDKRSPGAGNVVGVISDTHGLLRPEVMKVFEGVDLILHAGDIGTPDVLRELRTIAPVRAVRGNNDIGSWANTLLESETTQVGNVRIYMLHNLKEINLNPAVSGFQVVISGHSHKPLIEEREGTLFVNPGSAGPRRFKLPVSVARLIIDETAVSGEIIHLRSSTESG